MPTIPDFADLSEIRQRLVPDVQETLCLFVMVELEHSKLGEWL